MEHEVHKVEGQDLISSLLKTSAVALIASGMLRPAPGFPAYASIKPGEKNAVSSCCTQEMLHCMEPGDTKATSSSKSHIQSG